MAGYRIPYRRDSASDDKVWTPPEMKQLSQLSSKDIIEEYVTRTSVDENLLSSKYGLPVGTNKDQPIRTSRSLPPVVLDLRGEKSHRRSYQHRTYSGGGDNPSILIDWNNTSGWTRMIGFNLELWWSRSSILHRLNAGLVALCLAIFVMNFIFGVYLISTAVLTIPKNPYLCEEEDCQKASQWITSTMNVSVDPCDNFYEFVCGNYRQENEKEGSRFESLIQAPGFSVEFGENSILAKILKNFRNDPALDQAIRFFQACLNTPKRKEFGMEAFLEMVEHVFGTRDFSTFEQTALTMEEIGTRLFQVVGHASYINMAFFTYPYITILRPTLFTRFVHFHQQLANGLSWNNAEFSLRLLQGLMPALGVPVNATMISDMVWGFQTIVNLVRNIDQTLKNVQVNKTLDAVLNDATVRQAIKNLLDKKLCPPMGIQLNTTEVIRMFVKEDYKMEFVDLTALKHFVALKVCFEENPSSFDISYKFQFPKAAFVALWLLDLFWEYHIAMESKQIMEDYGVTNANLPHNLFVSIRFKTVDTGSEYLCFISLYEYLGYTPSIQYLLSITDNPTEFIGKIQDDIIKLFEKFSGIFDRIPADEITTISAHLGRIQFARGLYVDVGLPFVSGLLDNSSVADYLSFTDDHLRNSIIGTKYIIEKARQNWIGSTNSHPIIKWWGSGSPSSVRTELLDLREPMNVPSQFVEMNQPGEGKGHWEKFLRKIPPNYVLYPLTIIAQPFVHETLALRFAGYTQKLLRSFLTLNEYQFMRDKYGIVHNLQRFGFFHQYICWSIFNGTYPKASLSYTDIFWIGSPEYDNGANRTCSVLYNDYPYPPEHLEFTYSMLDSFTLYDYSRPDHGSNYNTVLALKEGLRLFRQERAALSKLPFNFTVSQEQKELHLQRYLPGKKISQLSEDQLYFVAYVRQVCRGSWKTHNDHYRDQRWVLETIILDVLMQTEEFAHVWNCPKNSLMNNKGRPRCIQWVPT